MHPLRTFITETALGSFRLTVTETAVCAIVPAAPGSPPSEPPNALGAEAARQLQAYCRRERHTFDLPLQAEGSSFARRVRAAAASVPYGQTCTYGEIAAMIGQPGAARAVGAALGKNPLLIVIPCHRIIAAGGKLGGYAGGTALKSALLALEQRQQAQE